MRSERVAYLQQPGGRICIQRHTYRGDRGLGVLNVCGPNMAQGFVALLVVIQLTNQNVNMRCPNSSIRSERTFCTSWPIGFDSP